MSAIHAISHLIIMAALCLPVLTYGGGNRGFWTLSYILETAWAHQFPASSSSEGHRQHFLVSFAVGGPMDIGEWTAGGGG